MNWKAYQQALLDKGFDPKGIDGEPGRNTQAATARFQKSIGLPGSGIPGPKTFAALGIDPNDDFEPPWMAIARSKIGMHEVKTNADLRKFLASDGHTLGNPATLPWCGDFVETCVALALPKEPIRLTTHNNPYWAKNWTSFGIMLAEPSPGAIMVFGRDGGGHVAFYVGEEGSNYIVLGGNQSNAVSIMKIAKSRRELNGIRWPKTYKLPSFGPRKMSLKAALSKNEA